MSKSFFLLNLRRAVRSLWFLPILATLSALVLIAAAPALERFVPEPLHDLVDPSGVETMLGILATSMLSVAIFSLGTMVSALEAAAGSATPRARILVSEDRTAHTAISTFIGAFLFGVLGTAGLVMDAFGPGGQVIMAGMTLLIVALVVVVLVLWIRRLSDMGGVPQVVDVVEQVAARALLATARRPHAGGARSDGPPGGAAAVAARAFGVVDHIDSGALCAIGKRLERDIHIAALPGTPMHAGRPLAHVAGPLSDKDADAIRRAFVMKAARSFDNDPRFGLIALSEIAQRALSPAVNDPGTAIDVLATLTRLLAGWAEASDEGAEAEPLARVFAPALDVEDMLADGFRGIARDGAAMLEVMITLQKGLGALATLDPERFGAPARAMAAEALERARAAMTLPADVERVADARRNAGLT